MRLTSFTVVIILALTASLLGAPPAQEGAGADAKKPAAKKLPASKAGKWLDDHAEAAKLAADTGLPILLDFTGSDWCGWCVKLKKEVFDQRTFKDYAKDSLVLVEVDFPRGKKLPAKVKEQNTQLQQKFGIKGFPTIILTDADGKELARTGYQEGGAKKYVEHLKELLQNAAPPAK